MTPKFPRKVDAQQALDCLEQAWAYYTPMPRIVTTAEAPKPDQVWPDYFAAA
ncbi:hypothetical protein VK792_01020 [Mesobacterium sp. TK19101]|uniref:Uncharacterized protein n=1 Tax=Mesobacterium hydrothermale TaxID=3111907 RepID=A0ABU6HCZ0_9RHOB|nr:hypothetical protein [Mesobacterium sp. TK19101]MEC3859851.1 hypothetical protein [Mesobacterium sp. TK19101]